MTARKRTSRLNRLFHKPVGHSEQQSWLRYGLLKSFFLLSKAAARTFPGKERKWAWQGLSYKIQAYSFFEHVNIILDLKPQTQWSLEGALERIQAFPPEYRVWAVEGVGYIYAERILKQTELPDGLLQNKNLPRWSLGSLHSGMGMLFAIWFLQNFKKRDSSAISSGVLEQYLSLASENTMPGYREIPVESLGFITRLMHPQQVPVIDKILQEINRDFAAYFWHGVGRALCFLPENMRPGRTFPNRAVEMAGKEAPHEPGYLNVLSGLGWPLTLVNIKEPRILEYVLTYHRDRLLENDAFSKGVSSAIVLLQESIRDKTLISSFLEHKPDSSVPGLLDAWEQMIKNPCKRALEDYYPYLKKQNCWSEVFKYRQNRPG